MLRSLFYGNTQPMTVNDKRSCGWRCDDRTTSYYYVLSWRSAKNACGYSRCWRGCQATARYHSIEPTNERHYCVNINVASRTDEENTFTNFRFKQYTKNTCVILRIDKGVLNVTAHFWLSFCFSFTFRLDPSLWVGRVRRTTERYTFLPLFECNCRRYGWI